MAEVGVDEPVALPGVPVRRGPCRPGGLVSGMRGPAGSPGLRRLSGPQGPVAQGKESGRRHGEQGRTGEGRYQAVCSDGGEEPEPENAEQGDEGRGGDGQDLPGTQVSVTVEVECDFPAGQYREEQDGPYQRAVLAGVERLSGEVAGHAVECDGPGREGNLARQGRAPPGTFGLDGLVRDPGRLLGGLGLLGGPGAADRRVSGPASAQALVLHRVIRRVDVADQLRHVGLGH